MIWAKRRERRRKAILDALGRHPVEEFTAWEIGALVGMKAGTYYPIIYGLEHEGLISSRWVYPDGSDRRRRLYSLA